jgi:hypothetical protein
MALLVPAALEDTASVSEAVCEIPWPAGGWIRDVVPDADGNRIGRRAGLGDYCVLPEA